LSIKPNLPNQTQQSTQSGSVQTGLQWASPAWSGGCLSQYGESVQYTNVSEKEIATECQKEKQKKKEEEVIEFRC